jgi:hypothetical protein
MASRPSEAQVRSIGKRGQLDTQTVALFGRSFGKHDRSQQPMAKQQNKSKQTIEKEFFEHVRPSSPLKWFAMADEVAAMVAVGSCFPLVPECRQT